MGAWRRGREGRKGRAGAAVAVFAATVVVLSGRPAGAATPAAGQVVRSVALGDVGVRAPVIDPGTVTELSDPGVTLSAPSDGRLRGDGIALIVTGAALADRAGSGDEAVSAGSGRHLIVFGFRQVPQTDQSGSAVVGVPPASLALVTAGRRASIILPASTGLGPWFYAASIPAGSGDVDLELSSAGYAQRFSLMTLTRLGASPSILYRDVDNPQVVVDDSSAVGVGAVTGPPDSTSYQLLVSAAVTTIGWFAPDASLDTPASADRAFLAVQLKFLQSLQGNVVVHLNLPAAIPATHVHLVLGDGTRVQALHTGEDDNTLSGVYYFAVPADIAAGSVAVDAYAAPGEVELAGFVTATISLAAFTINLALPSAPAPPPAVTTPVTTLKLTASTPTAAGSAGRAAGTGGGRGPVLSLAGFVVVAGIGAAGWMWYRRRRQPASVTADMKGVAGATAPWPDGAFARPPESAVASTPRPPLAGSRLPVPPPPAGNVTSPNGDHPPASVQTVRPVAASPAPTLTDIPAGPAEPPKGVLYFAVLGPLSVTGRPDDQPWPVPILDLGTYLPSIAL